MLHPRTVVNAAMANPRGHEATKELGERDSLAFRLELGLAVGVFVERDLRSDHDNRSTRTVITRRQGRNRDAPAIGRICATGCRMLDFERLGTFYLGKRFDPASQATDDDLLLYDSKDLTTHAACIGMTGSGKTGLALSLIEEALIDGVPCLIVDPKGDLGNLLLTFPELRAEDFRPWVDPEEARRRTITVDELAAEQARAWREGLAEWGQDGERIRRLRNAADLALYTPGSRNGRPVAAIRSFAAPAAAVREDPDAFREHLVSTTTGLLSLLGIDADPLRSREHILVAKILEHAWREGSDLDIATLVRAVQEPPLTRIGAFELETFFPAKERFDLALQLNTLLAAPGMDAWMAGEPLDIAALLHTASGKPRASIFSIAHLGDAERMFFVTLLLTEIVAWMRTQPGSTSLRAIVYMDEVFGYFPPVANPPSKAPLLTLLKQARAFGVGVVLATQNPVDIDYKGLANMGTWFLGRLQTEQDRARVLDGLMSANARIDRNELERLLASLGKRVFLMNNVHDDAPTLFRVRWALSYLRGPLRRDEIGALARTVAAEVPHDGGPAPRAPAERPAGTELPPVFPPDVAVGFLPVRRAAVGEERLVYEPALLGVASLEFRERRGEVDERREVALLAPFDAQGSQPDWEAAERLVAEQTSLDAQPQTRGSFAPTPDAALQGKSYARWATQLGRHLQATEAIELFHHSQTKLTSAVEETERDFRVRVLDALRAQRDEKREALERSYAPRLATLQERIRTAEQRLEREREQVRHQGLQTAISIGASLLGAVLGRRVASVGTVGRATTAARSAGRVLKERGDAARAEETLAALQTKLADLASEFEREAREITTLPSGDELVLDTTRVRPTKSAIAVQRVSFAWTPWWCGAEGGRRAAWS